MSCYTCTWFQTPSCTKCVYGHITPDPIIPQSIVLSNKQTTITPRECFSPNPLMNACYSEFSCRIHTEGSAVHLPQRVSHASLVSQEGSEVDRFAGVIFGPGTHLAPMLLATLAGQEPHVSVAGCVEFAMRLEKDTESHYLTPVPKKSWDVL